VVVPFGWCACRQVAELVYELVLYAPDVDPAGMGAQIWADRLTTRVKVAGEQR